MNADKVNRAKGALVGLALGDALGTTLEFQPRPAKPVVTDLVGGGPFMLEPGQWTDDTSMMLCLADSLIERAKMLLPIKCDAISTGAIMVITPAPEPVSILARPSPSR